ncbi:MAG: hypothetical protein IKG27_00185 [Bacilli bacterium]|nr:hypothetical protein [Bacilli bacterium]
MEKYKLTKKNKIVAIAAGIFLAFTVGRFTAHSNNTPSETAPIETSQDEIVEEVGNDIEIMTEEVEEQTPQVQTNPDDVINAYLNDLKEGFNYLTREASEHWNDEEFQAKLAIYKQRLKDLLDFVFNGKEINGITFNELSEEAKRNVMESIIELDSWIEQLFPNYKERIYEWLVGLGADGVELWHDLEEGFGTYADDVMEELSSRGTSYINKK